MPISLFTLSFDTTRLTARYFPSGENLIFLTPVTEKSLLLFFKSDDQRKTAEERESK